MDVRGRYARHRHWHKFEYTAETLNETIHASADWAEGFALNSRRRSVTICRGCEVLTALHNLFPPILSLCPWMV